MIRYRESRIKNNAKITSRFSRSKINCILYIGVGYWRIIQVPGGAEGDEQLSVISK